MGPMGKSHDPPRFVKDQLEAAEDLAESGFNLLLLYKAQALCVPLRLELGLRV